MSSGVLRIASRYTFATILPENESDSRSRAVTSPMARVMTTLQAVISRVTTSPFISGPQISSPSMMR